MVSNNQVSVSNLVTNHVSHVMMLVSIQIDDCY